MGMSMKQLAALGLRVAADGRTLVQAATLPAKPRRRQRGEGKISQMKAWQREMDRLPGLFLPLRTISEHNHVRGEHWTVSSKRAASQRATVKAVFCSRGLRLTPPFVRVRVAFHRYAPTLIKDDDNLKSSMKHVRDEIAACLGMDDGDARWVWQQPTQEKAPFYGLRLTITVEEP